MNVVDEVRRGNYTHNWTTIKVLGIDVGVSVDALKVGGVRVTLTGEEAQQVADLLGGMLPVPAVLDARHEAAQYVPPKPGNVVNRTGAEHSGDIDRAVLDSEEMISNVGKHWVLCARMKYGCAPLYGWHVEDREGSTWKGIKVWPPASTMTESWTIQPVSPTAHNYHHKDYSMTGVFMLLEDPEQAKVLEPQLEHLRLPGVRKVYHVDPVWRDESLYLPERCLAWMGYQFGLGIREIPGAEHSADILSYSENCRRGGDFLGVDHKGFGIWDGGTPLPLRKDEDPWCAATASESLRVALWQGENPPHGLRVSVRELCEDAVKAETLRLAGYMPRPGDLAIMARKGQNPLNGGSGHVRRVVQVLGNDYVGIGGNERNAIQVATHKLVDAVGWITYY